MATKKESQVPKEKLALYARLIATNPKVELKGATIPYTSHNGHMFSNFNPDGSLGLRLPPYMIEAFLKKYNTSLVAAFGIVRKEYVVVPDDLLQNTEELKPYFEKSFEYVSSLKPKPTKRPKKV
jgi:hypothetical protein